MRKLQFSDVFSAARLIKEIGLRDEIKRLTVKVSVNEDKEKVALNLGLDLLLTVIERACEKNAENKIYEFLAGPFEMTIEEVAAIDPLEIIEKMKEVADFNKWKDFLSKAAQLMK